MITIWHVQEVYNDGDTNPSEPNIVENHFFDTEEKARAEFTKLKELAKDDYFFCDRKI